jgi:DNA-binding SARP family transcriptional activator
VIEFRTLGALDLRAADGRELHSLLAQPKRIALLAYLCAARPRGFQRRDTLLGLFWPNADAEHARTSLRKSLHILRRVLGEAVILTRGDDDVAVDPEKIHCDVALFDELVRTKKSDEASSLYEGDFLQGVFVDDAPEFDQWLASERDRLRLAAADAALVVAELFESSKDHGGALKHLRRALALNRTDERVLRKMLVVQTETGDRAGAIATYEAFATRLRIDYQTEPALDTRNTIASIRSAGASRTRGDASSVESRAAVRESVAPAPMATIHGEPTEHTPRTRSSWRVVAGSAVAIPLLLLLGNWSTRGFAQRHQVLRYTLVVDSTEAVTPGPPWSGRIAISPDGGAFAYIGGLRGQLLIRPRNELHATPIAGTEDANSPFFSPDSKRVGFLREEKIFVVPAIGGVPELLSESLSGLAGASWGTDGFIYADGRNRAPLARVRATIGAKPEWFTVLDTAKGEIDHAWPDALPSGKGVIFTVRSLTGFGRTVAPSFSVAVAEPGSGKHRILLKDAAFARYAQPGYLLYVTTARTLRIVPFDQQSLRLTGTPTTLITGLRVSSFGLADVALSSTGTLLYSSGPDRSEKELVWVSRDGTMEPVDQNWRGDFYAGVDLSRDGKRIAVTMRPGGLTCDIWVKLPNAPATRLTFDGSFNLLPAWTPDGEAVTYTAATDNSSITLRTRHIDGTSAGTRSYEDISHGILGQRWSADGRWLVFTHGSASGGSFDIIGLRREAGTTPVPLLAERYNERSPALSADNKWMAYESDETGRPEIYVVPFPNTQSAKWAITTSGGRLPRWSSSGRELFYRDTSGAMLSVPVETRNRFAFGVAQRLFDAPFAAFDGDQVFAVAPDGRFLMIRNVGAGINDKLIVVENWFEELRGTEWRK